jgi:hypothetical protein
MLYPPHWFEGLRVVGQSGNDMPVDVGQLVPKEFVVHLSGIVDQGQSFGE